MSRDKRLNRRQVLKATGALTTSALIAGCQSSETGDANQDTPTTEEKTKKEAAPQDLSPAEWRKEKVEQAKEELQGGEQINWITTMRDPEVVENWVAAWDEEYPELEGKIKPIQGRTSELAQRYQREAQSNNLSVDVIRAGATFQALTAKGYQLGDMREVAAWEEVPDDLKESPIRGVMSISCWLPAQNTELVDQAPETWEDMMADRFSGGKIVLDYTPNPGKAGYVLVKLGEDWLKKFGDQQDPRLIKSGYKITKQVADGKVPLSFFSNFRHINRFKDKGLPVAPTHPNLTRLQRSSVFLPPKKLPPHPAAGRLFADFLMRPENKDLQIQRPGSMATDMETINPSGAKKYFENAELVTPTEAMKELNLSMNELITTYQEALDAPTA